jgi:hypothetical protein
MFAAHVGHAEVVKLLVHAGADVNAQNKVTVWLNASVHVSASLNTNVPRPQEGWSSLMLASEQGHVTVVQLLVGAGADVCALNKVCYFIELRHLWHERQFHSDFSYELYDINMFCRNSGSRRR